jgi:RIO-like serine/threonine protein kinase
VHLTFDNLQVEMGSKNHEVVPTPLIAQISGLRNGGVNKSIGSLAKRNLVGKVQNSRCEYCQLLLSNLLSD